MEYSKSLSLLLEFEKSHIYYDPDARISADEIAEIMGISKMTVYRIVEKFRKRLSQRLYGKVKM